MSTVDIKGMIGFSTAIHSMVSGLKILDGQIGNLMPSFGDMTSLIRNITETFVYSDGRAEDFGKSFDTVVKHTKKAFDTMGESTENFAIKFEENMQKGDEASWAFSSALRKMGMSYGDIQAELDVDVYWDMADAFKAVTGKTLNYADAVDLLNMSEKERLEWVDKQLHTGGAIEHQLDKQTNALKSQTGQLNKISGAIEPLIAFLQTLGTLMDLTLGEDAIIPDLVMLQEAFALLETTMLNLGTTLQTVDMSTPITQAITDSEDFRTSMEENGAELAILMTYIETLMGYYVDLAQTMADLSKLQEELGKGGLDVGTAFGNIRDYIEGLTAFIPDLATALIALKTVWDENSDAIHDGIDAFNEVMGAITNVKVYMDKWIQAELDIETATDNATEAVGEESVELENLLLLRGQMKP
jgi:methyl-accepting chemotaxis protein